MSDDENYSPGNSGGDDDDEYDPDIELQSKPKPKPKRSARRKSKSSKKTLSEDEDDGESPLRRSKRRASSANKKKPRRNSSTKSAKPAVVNLDTSTDDEVGAAAIVIPPQSHEADNTDDVELVTNHKKKGKKRTSTEANLQDPPAKKARTSSSSNTSSTNSASSSSTKSSKKTPKSFSSTSTSNTNSNSSKNKKKSGKDSKTAKKKKPPKGDAATERIRQFMMDANRPYSASALKPELKDEIGAAQIKKSLAALHKDGTLAMREFGKKSKTQIYWRNQDSFDEGKEGEEDEAAMLQRMQELELTIRQKRDALATLKATTKALKQTPKDDEIEHEMKLCTSQYMQLEEQVKKIESGEAPKVSKEDLATKLVEFHRFAKAWKERKAIVYDMISQIFQDCKEKPDKIISTKFKGETDKENDVKWDEYKELFVESSRALQQQRDARRKK
eukprot:CAMPEP_0197052692 /NCGR_PEP_ID=MMETSP1384-20130603/27119_1 /TAXON_ID=29189 /ORGANISM="Ammonia sp." /LENGTH=444 /DNA_ID=CAMNT_0042485483 /DNA_START=52 /DNA_END=1386 /DNA_ORIENTATION=-